jgi:hypothetical protein
MHLSTNNANPRTGTYAPGAGEAIPQLDNGIFIRFSSVLAFVLATGLFGAMQSYESGGYSLLVVILGGILNFIFSFSDKQEIREAVHVLTFVLYLGIFYAAGISFFFFLVINA